MEKKCKKAKWLPGEALQIAVKRREVKSKGEKERYKHLKTPCYPNMDSVFWFNLFLRILGDFDMNMILYVEL